jgi:beta-phosphoglucomutase-like phosphatase (HAD superfamily)
LARAPSRCRLAAGGGLVGASRQHRRARRGAGPHDTFNAVVSAEEVAHGKPAPDVFLRAAEKVGVAPARCVVVEDAAIGVEAGRRGGMRTIGIEGGHSHGPLQADVVTRSMADLPLDTFDKLLS